MHMENTPQGPDGQRVSMCLITWVTLVTYYERVTFSEFLISDWKPQLAGWELSHTRE